MKLKKLIAWFHFLAFIIHDLLLLNVHLSGKNQSWSAERELWQHDYEQLDAGLEEQQGNFSIRLIASSWLTNKGEIEVCSMQRVVL